MTKKRKKTDSNTHTRTQAHRIGQLCYEKTPLGKSRKRERERERRREGEGDQFW